MPTTKPIKRRSGRKSAQAKETRSDYTARTGVRLARTSLTELEFHVSLPSGATVDEFTDKLIELVEAYGGMVAGGTVAAKA